MPVAVNPVHAKENRSMETLLSALKLAYDVYNDGKNRETELKKIEALEAETNQKAEAAKSKEQKAEELAAQTRQTNFAKDFAPVAEGTPGAMTGAQIGMPDASGYYKPRTELHNEKMVTARKQEIADNRTTKAQERADALEVRRTDKANLEIDRQVQKYGGDIQSFADTYRKMQNIEKELGFDLNDYDTKTGKVGDKRKDLPGISLPVLGRVSFYNKDARTLETKAAAIFNAELKDRSGSAVTSPELERLRTEFGAGKFNTESELIGALKDYKNALIAAVGGQEAKYRPEAIEEARARGQFTSASITPYKPQEETGGGIFSLPKANAASPSSQYAPGTVIEYNGARYRINNEGKPIKIGK